ncbi:MAG: hypothetical protein RLZZ423_39 [Cyanobacteriota bacterium]|jgi:hypothetical protein
MTALTPRAAGVRLALLQIGLLVSLGGGALLERAWQPRGWARVVPVDPQLPIRGRYVSLGLLVPAPRLEPGGATTGPRLDSQAVQLMARDGFLEAIAAPADAGWPGSGRTQQARIERIDGTVMVRLSQPLAFFIPPDVPDPSRRPAGEELWVEATLPMEGAPRPIRLGVRRPQGAITPLRWRP